MKKLLALMLTLAMVFSLVACQESKDDYDEDEGIEIEETESSVETTEETAEENPEETKTTKETKAPEETAAPTAPATEATAASTEPAKEVEIGSVKDNKYTNNFIGITCELDDDWTFKTDEEIRQINNIAQDLLSENYKEGVEYTPDFTDMYATNSSGETLSVAVAKLTGMDLYLNAKGLAASSLENMKSGYESTGMTNVNITLGTQTFAGAEHICVLVSADLEGVTICQRIIILRCGDYAVMVGAASWNTDSCKANLDNFKAIEK